MDTFASSTYVFPFPTIMFDMFASFEKAINLVVPSINLFKDETSFPYCKTKKYKYDTTAFINYSPLLLFTFFFFFFYIMKFKDRNSVVYVKILMGFQFITKYTFSMINKKKNSLVIQGKSIYILFV